MFSSYNAFSVYFFSGMTILHFVNTGIMGTYYVVVLISMAPNRLLYLCAWPIGSSTFRRGNRSGLIRKSALQ